MRMSLRAPVFHYCYLNELGINPNIWILTLIFPVFALLNVHSLINPTTFSFFNPKDPTIYSMCILSQSWEEYVNLEVSVCVREENVFLKSTATAQVCWLSQFRVSQSSRVFLPILCLLPLPAWLFSKFKDNAALSSSQMWLVPSRPSVCLTHCVLTSVVTIFLFPEVTCSCGRPFLLQDYQL